jgi:hypothetical protein
MSIVKKIILVIIILLFSIILYRLFEHRRTIQKNMENHVITEGYSGMNASNPDYSYVKSEVASVAIDAKLLPSGVQNYSSDHSLNLSNLCIKSSWNSAYSGGYVSDIMVQYVLSRGCRFLDFAVYLNDNNQAVIGYSSDSTVANPSIKNTQDITLLSVLQSTLLNAFGNQSGQTYQVMNTNDPLFINIRPRPFPNSDVQKQPQDALTKLRTLHDAINNTILSVKADPNLSRYFMSTRVTNNSKFSEIQGKVIILREDLHMDTTYNFFYNSISNGSDIHHITYGQLYKYDTEGVFKPIITGNQTTNCDKLTTIMPNNNMSSQSNPNIYSTISNYGINFNAMQYYKPDANLYECEKMFATYAGGIVPMAYCLNYINNNATPQQLETSGILTMFPSLF